MAEEGGVGRGGIEKKNKKKNKIQDTILHPHSPQTIIAIVRFVKT